jgi:hypothetical protein
MVQGGQEMNEATNLILAIFGAIMVWTSSIVGAVLWLSGKFRGVEQTIYKEMDKLRREVEARHYNINTRIQRLEIKLFGFAGPDRSTATTPQDNGQDNL